jgi:hypothetical protein
MMSLPRSYFELPLLLLCVVMVSLAQTAPSGSAPLPLRPDANAGGRSTVYFYRTDKKRDADSIQILVDGDRVATLHQASVASVVLVPGAHVLSVTDQNIDVVNPFFPPDLRWPTCVGEPKKANCTWEPPAQPAAETNRGCGMIKWRQLNNANSDDLAVCKNELNSAAAALDSWRNPNQKAGGLLAGFLIPGSLGNVIAANALNTPSGSPVWLQICGTTPFPKSGSPEARQMIKEMQRDVEGSEWGRCKNRVAEAFMLLQSKEFLRLDAEEGKSYYVRFNQARNGSTRAELVGSTLGGQAIIALQPEN